MNKRYDFTITQKIRDDEDKVVKFSIIGPIHMDGDEEEAIARILVQEDFDCTDYQIKTHMKTEI